MGLFLPLSVVLLLITLHRMQFLVFQDCLSKVQKQVRGLPSKEHFLQFAVRKVFRKKISKRGAKRLDYMLVFSSMIIAVLATIY